MPNPFKWSLNSSWFAVRPVYLPPHHLFCFVVFDGVKLRCPTLDPIRWLSAPELVDNGFPLSVVEPTGEIQRKPRTATYNGLTFALTPSSVGGYRLTVAGSIHKYHNGGTTNSNRFSLKDVQMCINNLHSRFGIEPDSTPLEGLEIGVNLSLPFSPARVIRSAIVCHNKPFTLVDANRPQLGKRCVLSEYELKLYDKGKQTGDKRANLLRVEVKVSKMRYLESYGVATLADLTNPAKAARLVEVLTDAIAGTVFIDALAEVDQLTPAEQVTFYRLRDADAWSSDKLTRRMRSYYRQQLPHILTKCNAYEYQTALHNWIIQEWNTLISPVGEAPEMARIEPDLHPSEAVENVTFSPLDYVGESVTSTLKRERIYFLAENSKNRVCLSCGKPLSGQKSNSRFCSEKYNGAKAARHCRNRDSNPRRTKRNQIMKANQRNQFLRITYTANGQTYTDSLHSSEVAVSREWLDSVVSVEVLPACRDADTSGPTCYSHCPCQPEIWNGNDAKQRLDQLTTENHPDLHSHTEQVICPNCQSTESATVTHSVPFWSYVHECQRCSYLICESEWDKAPA